MLSIKRELLKRLPSPTEEISIPMTFSSIVLFFMKLFSVFGYKVEFITAVRTEIKVVREYLVSATKSAFFHLFFSSPKILLFNIINLMFYFPLEIGI